MIEDTATPPPAQDVRAHRGFGGWLRDMPRWKKVALGVGLATVAISAVWAIGSDAGTGTGSSGQAGLASGLTAGTTGRTGEPAVVDEPAAKGVFRLGFSFVAGFCLGSFVRATLRIAAIAFGFWLAMTFVLAWYGLVVVDWNAISSVWDRFTSNVANEWGDFQRFVTGSLPAAGLAATGLAIGLKRH